jgi:hypothetical protein
MALEQINLTDLVTFSRSTTATRVNSAGLIETVAANVVRIDHDPVTKECLGFLSEGASTNILLHSSDFDNAVWSKTGCSVSANTVIGPDGTMTADKLIEDTATGFHVLGQNFTGIVSGTTYTLSFFAKAAERSHFMLHLVGPWATTLAAFDLGTGTFFDATGGTTARIENWGNGIYRCCITATANASGAGYLLAYLRNGASAGSEIYAGDGASGLHIWGAQLEARPYATSCIPTDASQVTRAGDSMIDSDISRWFNPLDGTIVGSFCPIGDVEGDRNWFILLGPTFSDFIGSNVSAGYNVGVRKGGVDQANITFPFVANTQNKVAIAYKENDVAASLNGGASQLDSAVSLPTNITQLWIGAIADCHIKFVKFDPKRLPNAKLQEMTA